MNKSLKSKLLLLLLLIVLVLFAVSLLIQMNSTRHHFVVSSEQIATQIHEQIHDNEERTGNLIASLKEEYIERAKAVAFLLSQDESIERDAAQLEHAAQLLNIDEINVFGTEGTILYSTVPSYPGVNMHDGEQIGFFLPMLADQGLTLCQDLTPNTYESKVMMYAAAWKPNGSAIIQVGITPQRLIEAQQEYDISRVLQSTAVGEYTYYVYDPESGLIVSCTNAELIGKTPEALSMTRIGETGEMHITVTNGIRAAYVFQRTNDHYLIGISISTNDLYNEMRVTAFIILAMLGLSMAVLYIVIVRKSSHEREIEREHREELQKALRQAQEASTAKSRFLFNMSHDLRTPMNAIIGFTELLGHNIGQPEREREYLEKIRGANGLLLDIINHVLEMARIENDKVSVEQTAIGLNAFADDIRSVFEGAMQEKGLKFTLDTRLKHDRVIGDATKQKEILLNLISNALKYTEKGSVSVMLDELPGADETQMLLRMTVRDTGIGMSEEFQKHIFDEFEREHTSTESKVIGTGLGMAITQRFVRLLGGEIVLESALGKGSCFTVTVPNRIDLTEEQPLQAQESAQEDAFHAEGRRILLTEDNELNAEIAIELLTDEGFKVEHAADGAKCVEMVKAAAPGYYDLILMDIQMPVMNGYEATGAIRRLDAARRGVPIIAMTANAFAEDRLNALEAGMDGHLAKPIDMQAVMEMLKKFLGKEKG